MANSRCLCSSVWLLGIHLFHRNAWLPGKTRLRYSVWLLGIHPSRRNTWLPGIHAFAAVYGCRAYTFFAATSVKNIFCVLCVRHTRRQEKNPSVLAYDSV